MAFAETPRQVLRLAREEQLPFKAASIAFYAVASFVPLLIVALAALSVVSAADALVSVLQSNLSESGTEVLRAALGNTRGRGVAGAVGFLVTLWSATKVFRGLSIAFAGIYRRDPDLSLLAAVRKSLVVIAALPLAVAALSATGVVLAYLPLRVPYPALVWNAVAVVALVVVLLPLYYALPPRSVTVRETLPGTVLAAVGWVLLQYGFSYYAQNAGTYAAYGFLGAVLLFVTLLYFAAIVLLVGAALNVVLGDGRHVT